MLPTAIYLYGIALWYVNLGYGDFRMGIQTWYINFTWLNRSAYFNKTMISFTIIKHPEQVPKWLVLLFDPIQKICTLFMNITKVKYGKSSISDGICYHIISNFAMV